MLGLLLCTGCAASEITPTTAPAPATTETTPINGTGLLWRIDLPGRAPSHIFGTLHLSDPRVVALPPAVEDAFESSASVGLESVKRGDSMRKIEAMGRLPAGRDLERIIGPDLFAEVIELSRSKGYILEELRLLTPWYIAILIEKMNRSPGGEPVLDEHLADTARAAGKTLFGLETVSENLAAYKDLPEAQQIDLLRTTLRAIETPEESRRAIRDADIHAYLAGDTGFLLRRWNAVFSTAGPERRQFGDRLLDQRSARFVDRMVPWIETGGSFFAIGAAHLPGKDGVIARLRDRGVNVVAVY